MELSVVLRAGVVACLCYITQVPQHASRGMIVPERPPIAPC